MAAPCSSNRQPAGPSMPWCAARQRTRVRTGVAQCPVLPPLAAPTGAYQDQGCTLRGEGAQAKPGRRPGVVETVLLRTCVILGVQRQTTADTIESTPRFSHRWNKDQGVGWTTERG